MSRNVDLRFVVDIFLGIIDEYVFVLGFVCLWFCESENIQSLDFYLESCRLHPLVFSHVMF